MKPGFPLKLAIAIVSIYAFVTILFLDGKNRDDAGSPPRRATVDAEDIALIQLDLSDSLIKPLSKPANLCFFHS